MSYEAWGDGADDGLEGYVTEQRAEEMFLAGAQAMREMLARFVESGGDTPCAALAISLRANWNPSWGKDPGKLTGEIPDDAWSA